MPVTQRIVRFAPGLAVLLAYDRGNLRADTAAGVSVAAVAVPVAIAYAQLAGFPPEVGLYSSILPLIAYAIFGTSRQLIVGPDAATCAMVAAAAAPLAAGDAALYQSLSVTLALFAGFLCVGARFLRLGVLADFLSRPVLIGLLSGVSLSIILGQLGKLFGYTIDSGGLLPRVAEFAGKLDNTHLPTLAVSAGALAILVLARRFGPRTPAALVTLVATTAAVALLGLDARGVAVVGAVPAGLPRPQWPAVPAGLLPDLLANAAGIALISFTSMIITARAFAARNHYDIDVDREFAALGAANIASALSQGFAVSGADSRTAVSDASGGRTQMTGLIAAAGVALVLFFVTQPLRYVPVAALGAVLVVSAVSLFDARGLRGIWHLSRTEFALAVVTLLGVVVVGVLQAVLLAVVLSLIHFVRVVARPRVEILGIVDGHPGFHNVSRHRQAHTTPGLMLVRFNSPLTFFNSSYFRQCVLAALDAADATVRWVVFDTLPVTDTDATGFNAFRELRAELGRRGMCVVLAGRQTETRELLRAHGWHPADTGEASARTATEWFLTEAERAAGAIPPLRLFPTLRKAYRVGLATLRRPGPADR